MNGRLWEPEFSLMYGEVTDKQVSEARMIPVMMYYGR